MNRPPRPSRFYLLGLELFWCLFTLVSFPVLAVMLFSKRKWRAGLRERMGLVPRLAPHPFRIWVHAVSVGEVEGARPLVAALRKRYPDADVIVSTTTRTGRERARKRFPELTIFHYPLDLPWAVRTALRRIRPTAVIEVEGEWWPLFLGTCARRGIPVCMTNARITEKAAAGYRKMSRLFRRMLDSVALVAVQHEEYAERLAALGAGRDRLAITGQMKYDNVSFDRPPGAEDLARAVGIAKGDRVLVAGSTGPGEEAILLDAFETLAAKHDDLRLVLVPRKPERFDEVAALVRERGHALVRRGETLDAPADAPPPGAVVLGDTMGELGAFYALATAAFVGRSLVPMGGSNPIEPASLAVPMVFGPHMFNFPEAEDLFVTGGAARVATDAESLARTLGEMLQSPAVCRDMGRRGREAIRTRQGATARTVELIAPVIERARAAT